MAMANCFSASMLLTLVTSVSSAPFLTTQDGDRPAARVSGRQIQWGPCPKGNGFPANVTCATYNVPLDWSNPYNGEIIELGMLRNQARDSSKRIGYLFINPGGPGGQASDTVAGAMRRFAPEILDRFDIIGLDPRGVGLSTPVTCDAEIWNQRVSFFPTTQKEYDKMVGYNKAAGESCRAKSAHNGRLIDFVDTKSAARDHEAVRKALGGEKATFLGLSYGTQLFSQYAEFYPDSIRAMVLDGILQHSLSESSNLLVESTTYETTLKVFFAWCNKDSACPLVGKDVQAEYLKVLALAKAAPIPAPGCRDPQAGCRDSVTEEEARLNIQGFLISTNNWHLLGQALIDAQNGDASMISQQQPLAVGNAYRDSYLFAGASIQCQDWVHASRSLSDLVQKEADSAGYSPLTRGASQTYKIQTSCIGWPAPLTNPERALKYSGRNAILMVNALHDPSTSYTWALGLYRELGNAVLLTRNGSGHTSYALRGQTTDAMNSFMINLTLPDPGTVLDS